MFVCFAANISPGQTLAVTGTQACLAQGCQYHQTGWYEYISDTCTDLISYHANFLISRVLSSQFSPPAVAFIHCVCGWVDDV